MKFNLPDWLKTSEIKLLFEIISDAGVEARFVGGCVRDALIGVIAKDIDIAVNIAPDEVIKIMNKAGIKTIPTGIKHGTVTALVNKKNFEITSLRKDISCDGRHAIISFTDDWKLDAARRDFTFNALYADLQGNIYDYFSGISDLQIDKPIGNSILRFINNPTDRIKEDYLRILRAFRFYAKICAKNEIDSQILNVISDLKENLSLLSGERIRSEVFYILSLQNAYYALNEMQKIGVLDCLELSNVSISGVLRLKLLEDNVADNNESPIMHIALLIRSIVCNIDSGKTKKDLCLSLCKRWKLSNDEKKQLIFLVESNTCGIMNHFYYMYRFKYDLYINIIKLFFAESNLGIENYYNIKDSIEKFENLPIPIKSSDIMGIFESLPRSIVGVGIKLCDILWISSNFSVKKNDILDVLLKILSKYGEDSEKMILNIINMYENYIFPISSFGTNNKDNLSLYLSSKVDTVFTFMKLDEFLCGFESVKLFNQKIMHLVNIVDEEIIISNFKFESQDSILFILKMDNEQTIRDCTKNNGIISDIIPFDMNLYDYNALLFIFLQGLDNKLYNIERLCDELEQIMSNVCSEIWKKYSNYLEFYDNDVLKKFINGCRCILLIKVIEIMYIANK